MIKFLIISALFFIGCTFCFSQTEPTQNYEQLLNNRKLKTLKTYYYTTEDTTQSAGRLLFRKDFDRKGKLQSKYIFTFWDVVSYDHTIRYTYDTAGNLAESISIQQILRLNKSDSSFVQAMGDEPNNEKIVYAYNRKKQLIKEQHFTFGKGGLQANDIASVTKTYEYDKSGRLVKETGTTPNGRVIYQNYITVYEYDAQGRKTKETLTYTSEATKAVKTNTYIYTHAGQLAEEITTDEGAPFNNKHIKYEYDHDGRKTRQLTYDSEAKKWKTTQHYKYNKEGKLIPGDDETSLTYYPDGLIKQELWKGRKGKSVVNFITYYEFY